jgi:hypothetical protein
MRRRESGRVRIESLHRPYLVVVTVLAVGSFQLTASTGTAYLSLAKEFQYRMTPKF